MRNGENVERHNDVELALWSYGAVEVAWLEQAMHLAPASPSAMRVAALFAQGGVVRIRGAAVERINGSDPLAGTKTYQGSTASDRDRRGIAAPCYDGLELEPGAGWLWSGRAPLTIMPHPPGGALLAVLPATTLMARLGNVDALTGGILSVVQGCGAVCVQLLSALVLQAPLLSAGQRLILGDGALDAIIVWLRGEQTTDDHLSTRRRELLNAIYSYIDHRLEDYQLCPRVIADRFGVSVRYLHMLFAATGITVTRWITIRRLEVIRSELLRCGGDHGSIRDIATRWGFHDLSRFSRVFRQHFGEPPSVYVRRRVGIR